MEIDSALVRGDSYRNVAERFNLALTSVYRHRCEHIPAALVQAREAEKISEADSLLNQVRSLQARALAILDAAESTGKLVVALAAIREARGNLELLGRLAGKLRDNQVTVNLVNSADWQKLRTAILGALEPYPEARASVAAVLLEPG